MYALDRKAAWSSRFVMLLAWGVYAVSVYMYGTMEKKKRERRSRRVVVGYMRIGMIRCGGGSMGRRIAHVGGSGP